MRLLSILNHLELGATTWIDEFNKFKIKENSIGMIEKFKCYSKILSLKIKSDVGLKPALR